MDTALDYLRRWHNHATRRRLLVLAIDQLRTYVRVCDMLLSEAEAKGTTSNELHAALQMLCWQWNASALLLCSRSAACLNAVKKQGPDLISRSICLLGHGPDLGVHQVAAQVRQLCILISHASGQKGCLHRAFDSFESKGFFLLSLLRGLELTLNKSQEDCNLALLITSILRSLILDEIHGDNLQLLESTADCQAFLLPLVQILQIGGRAKPKVRALEIFVADFMLQRNLTILTVTRRLREVEPSNLLVRRIARAYGYG